MLVNEVELKEENKLFSCHLGPTTNAAKLYLLIRGPKSSAMKSVPLDGNAVTKGIIFLLVMVFKRLKKK